MNPAKRRRVVLVSGLSGAGHSSILRALEDLAYQAIDNAPLAMLEELIGCGEGNLAIGVDTRTRGFESAAVLRILERMKRDLSLWTELVFAWADEPVLLRRYAETRRRHPLAPDSPVSEGIAAEVALTAPLRQAADLLIDTSELPLPELRRLITERFGPESEEAARRGLAVFLISFAYPGGLPREADLVLDARFLRNPHYEVKLRPRTGRDPEVGAYIEADPDYSLFYAKITDLLALLLPRFVQEGKKYATIAIGCTGGRHRSVYLVEKLSEYLSAAGWRVKCTHRELAREGEATEQPMEKIVRAEPHVAPPSQVQAQEA
jgi:UPF0042 nucleotide-binding protein